MEQKITYKELEEQQFKEPEWMPLIRQILQERRELAMELLGINIEQ